MGDDPWHGDSWRDQFAASTFPDTRDPQVWQFMPFGKIPSHDGAYSRGQGAVDGVNLCRFVISTVQQHERQRTVSAHPWAEAPPELRAE
jgi:hypothetical protein